MPAYQYADDLLLYSIHFKTVIIPYLQVTGSFVIHKRYIKVSREKKCRLGTIEPKHYNGKRHGYTAMESVWIFNGDIFIRNS